MLCWQQDRAGDSHGVLWDDRIGFASAMRAGPEPKTQQHSHKLVTFGNTNRIVTAIRKLILRCDT